MGQSTWVIALVSLILGGGGIGGLMQIPKFRAEKDNVIVTGSEAAVQSLMSALKQSDYRVTQCEAENAQLRIALEDIKIKLEAAEATVRQVSRDLAATKQRLDDIVGGK